MGQHFYIHIGSGKTGTTSIQSFMDVNREALSQNGVLYPECPKFPGCHHELIIDENWKFLSVSEVRKAWSAKIDEARTSRAKKVVLSSELLTGVFEDGSTIPSELVAVLPELLNGENVSIICFLRRHDQWLPSVYNQWLKSGRVRFSPEQFAQRCNFSHLKLLTPWAKAYGDQNVTVVPFEKRALQPSLEHVFLQFLGEEPKPEYVFPGRHNVSPGGEVLQLMVLLARQAEKGVFNVREYDELRRIVRSMPKEGFTDKKYNPFTPDTQRNFIESNESEYKEIARRFVKDNKGPLFQSPVAIDENGGGDLCFSDDFLMTVFATMNTYFLHRLDRVRNKDPLKKADNAIKKGMQLLGLSRHD